MAYFKGRRGQITGIVTVGVLVVVLFISLMVVGRFISEVATQFNNINVKIPNPVQNNQTIDLVTNQSKALLNNYNTVYPSIADYIISLVLIIMGISVIITSFFVDTHPLFFAIIVPIFLASMWVNGLLINIVDDLGNSSGFISMYSNMPITSFIVNHWLVWVAAIGGLTLVVLYTRK